ncbi:flagellar hook-length control protein FliK, partial [Pandoraea nosoerga]|uniref:flagellar hook-length control protein FliK n=2 Tax=Pseudomonadota TaxID=1224 RepID=UPI00197EF4E9
PRAADEAAADAAKPRPADADAGAQPQAAAAGAQQPQAPAGGAHAGPETVSRLAAQITRKIEGKATRFDIALDPVGLGHVNVKVEISARGELTASLAFDNPQAAAELKNRAGELHQALEQAGFDLSKGGLSFGA